MKLFFNIISFLSITFIIKNLLSTFKNDQIIFYDSKAESNTITKIINQDLIKTLKKNKFKFNGEYKFKYDEDFLSIIPISSWKMNSFVHFFKTRRINKDTSNRIYEYCLFNDGILLNDSDKIIDYFEVKYNNIRKKSLPLHQIFQLKNQTKYTCLLISSNKKSLINLVRFDTNDSFTLSK